MKHIDDMKAKDLLFICGISGVALCGCQERQSADNFAHFTDSDKDLTVRPGDDFYQYVNGGWCKSHPLPDDKSRFSSFDIVNDDVELKLKAIVEEASLNPGTVGSANQRVGDFYASGMDMYKRNADGVKMLFPLFESVDNMEVTPTGLALQMAAMLPKSVSLFLSFYSSPDMNNSSMNIAELWQSGLGIGDRDYYLLDDERSVKIREGYVKLLTKYMTLLGWENVEERAKAVMALETRMAEAQNNNVENRDPQKIYNPMTLEQLKAEYTFVDWDAFFGALGVEIKTINVSQPKYMAALNNIVSEVEPDVLKDYIKMSLVTESASLMSQEYLETSFDFYGRTMSGSLEMRPLWKRVLGVVDNSLGEQIGEVFVQKHFPPSAKERMEKLVEHLRVAFSQRIDKLTWMGDSTKVEAKDKLAAIDVKIGYPVKWRDYSSVVISREKSFLENYWSACEYSVRYDLAKINNPVDRSEWYMTPQTVNAYYNPLANEIVFPAGILQPPFFYAEGDDAVNYGAIGVVIGHEMTHGFDDMGCQFDKEGNLNNWWTAEDSERFTTIGKKIVERFSKIEVEPGYFINGELTLGENIADLGGVNISYQAFRNACGETEPALIDEQTADQRFLYSYARVWANNIRRESLINQVKTDPHSPGKYRVNGTIPMVDVFYNAFGVTEKDSLYVASEERISLW
jgi:putative endopeptidase